MTTLRGLMRIRLAGLEYGGKDAVPTFPAIASRHRVPPSRPAIASRHCGQGRGARRRASVLPGRDGHEIQLVHLACRTSRLPRLPADYAACRDH
ncbi:hypothetical protein BMG523Draft_04290 [Frankia sp. BMG5.23]|nr:hypothetical protein BMG523Draft_04290 [Frankia sp. BMG5.23]